MLTLVKAVVRFTHQSCACAKRLLDSALGILIYVCLTVLVMYRAARIAVRGKWQVPQCLIRLQVSCCLSVLFVRVFRMQLLVQMEARRANGDAAMQLDQ